MRNKLLWLWLLPLLFFGCGAPPKEAPQQDADFPITLTDAFGEEVQLEKLPQRIISLAPSHTEILFALGLDERIVGVTNWCNWPEEATEKTKVGDLNLNFEEITVLKPDLIVGIRSMQEDNLLRLKKQGFTVLALEPEGIAGTLKTIKTLGRATGQDKESQDLVAKIEGQLASIKPQKRVKALMVLDLDPLYSVGPGSLQHELLTKAGFENIAQEGQSPWPQLSDELVVDKDPAVLLLTADLKERIREKTAWQNVKAVKMGAIYQLDPDLLSRPGPRVGEAALELARILKELEG